MLQRARPLQRIHRLAVNCALAVLLLLPLVGCGRTPQLAGDQECLGAADALWTAIGAKRTDLVDASAAMFDQLHADGKMPDDAYQALGEIVGTARSGQWSDARAELKSFVKGQRPAPAP